MNTYITQKFHLCAAVLGAMAIALLPSCQDEDFGFTSDEIRQEAYSRNFKEIFGEVDPDHNWSMAQNVKVNINVPGANGYTIRIYTETPENRDAVLLYAGTMPDDILTVNVDVVHGSKYVYVQIGTDFGVYLADGYYAIEEDGRVEVNKAATRAASASPSITGYTQTITRWSRVWDNSKDVSSPYKWDWGFTGNAMTFIDGDSNSVPDGWRIHAIGDDTPNDRVPGSDYGSSGPRTVSLPSGTTAFGTSVDKGILLRRTGCYAQYGGHQGASDDRYIYIPAGPTRLHFAISRWETDYENQQLKISVIRKKDDNSLSEEKTETFTITKADFTLKKKDSSDAFSFSDKIIKFNANGGQYFIKFELTSGIDWQGVVLGGFSVEPKADDAGSSYGWSTYQENVDRYITYRDVRGGGVNRWLGDQYRQLLNETTYRDNANNDHFEYRTYNVRKMVDANGTQMIAEGVMGPFYMISGGDGTAILDEFEQVKYKDMFPLYGMYKSTTGSWRNSPFGEGVNHIDPYFSDGYFTADEPDMEMKHDAQCITLGKINTSEVQYDGSVKVKMMGLGTGHKNDVGYFYYKKSDEDKYIDYIDGKPTVKFNKVVKVVIRKNMQNVLTGNQPWELSQQSGASIANYGVNSTHFNRYANACFALSLSDSEFNTLKTSGDFKKRWDENYCRMTEFVNGLKEKNPDKINDVVNCTFNAPVYKLPFFGDPNDSGQITNTTGSYEWPEGYVIGFFGIRTSDEAAAELSRIYTSSASVQLNYFNDLPRGSAFSYKGKNYIGLEDEWDYDNNDFLFQITGIQSVDPDITPEDDPESEKNTQSWVIACEDLGGTWDYDFNDLVWTVEKEVVTTTQGNTTWGTTDIYFRALAAGGTLEAIVEYNPSMELDTSNDPDESHWIQLGEIHNLVKRTSPLKKNDQYETPTSEQLNVTKGTLVKKDMVGNRIKLGTTIPTNSSDITMANILTHFRVRVYYPNGTSMIVRNVSNIQSEASQSHNHSTHNTKKDADKTPQFLLLPPGWAWPAEGVCIQDVYNLSDWVKNQNNTTEFQSYWDWRNSGKGGDFVTYTLDE